MRKRIMALVVVALLLSMVSSTALAQGVDPGTGKTNIFMQNLGTNDAQVRVFFYREDTGQEDWDYTLPDTIPPKGAKYLLYRDFGVGDNWSGAAELAATEPLAAIVNMFWDGSSAPAGAGLKATQPTAGTYTGVDAPATEAYLPGLAKKNGRQTRVTVQNTEDTTANVSLMFYDRDGTLTGTKNDTISPKAEKTYYLDQVAECDFAATKGIGSLYITSSTKIATMASLHAASWSVAYSGASTGDTVIWMPGIFRRQTALNVWQLYNAVIIQNLGSSTANITVDMIGIPGKASTTFTDTIPPKASYGINTKSAGTMDPTKWATVMTALGTQWQGSAKVTCTNGQPLTGVSFFFLPSAVPDALAYNAIRASDATTNAISLPAVYRKLPATGNWQWSTTLVQNLDATAGTINVKFYRSDGTQAGAVAGYNVPLPANSSVRLNMKVGLELPAQALSDIGNFFSGAMLVTSTSGNSIVAINNIIHETLSRAAGYPGFPIQ